jgi:hypothetical protein
MTEDKLDKFVQPAEGIVSYDEHGRVVWDGRIHNRPCIVAYLDAAGTVVPAPEATTMHVTYTDAEGGEAVYYKEKGAQ